MGIGERIKEVRKVRNKTQQAFADTIGLKRNTIANYEIGNVEPSDRTISDICREFNVNEEWLRTGEGEMFKPKSRNEELFEFVTNAIGEPTGIQAKLLSIMARLTDEQGKVLNDIATELANDAAEDGQKEQADP